MFPLIDAIIENKHEHILVHTGQHYDIQMSDVFFQELSKKMPDYNLDIGSGLHGYQTGEILKRVEDVILKEEPDLVLVPGDTNSTLGGALAATKLHVKLGHLEAGLRSFDKRMPEEINRILTDHCSNLLFCPTNVAIENLQNEGITSEVYSVGDTIFEIAMKMKKQVENIKIDFELPDEFILLTIHQAENTNQERLPIIVQDLFKIKKPIILPIHPRTKSKLIELDLFDKVKEKLIVVEPLGYLKFTKLLRDAKIVITDSGGVQKEAYWNQTPCITVRDSTEWLETIRSGGNFLAEPNTIHQRFEEITTKDIDFDENLYGYEDTSKRIVKIIEESM